MELYVIQAIDSVTGNFIGYYSKGDIFIKTRPQIKYAKKFLEKEGENIKHALSKCKKRCKYYGLGGHKISWKIKSVPI